MPELAEVELARRIWEPGLGQGIVAIDTHPRTRVYRDTPASTIESALSHKILLSSRAHGKRLLFSFGPRSRRDQEGTSDSRSATTPRAKLHLELHLGMSGRLFIAAPDHPAAKHDHFVLRTRELALVYSDYRQFGRVHLHAPVDDPWSELPIEVHARLSQEADRPPREEHAQGPASRPGRLPGSGQLDGGRDLLAASLPSGRPDGRPRSGAGAQGEPAGLPGSNAPRC